MSLDAPGNDWLTVGSLANACGVRPRTVRYYAERGLLRAGRNASGYRLFPPDAPARLRFIRAAQSLGMSLADIGRLLAVPDGGAAPCEHVRTFVHERLDEIAEQRARLDAAERELQNLDALLADGREPAEGEVCPCIAEIAGPYTPGA